MSASENGAKPSVYFALPAYDAKAWTPWISCLLETTHRLRDAGIPHHVEFLEGESLIPRGRNRLARMFREATSFSHIMSIDTDLSGWGGNHIIEMLKANVDMIGGVYPMKNIDTEALSISARWGARGKALLDTGAVYVFNMTPEQAAKPIFGSVFEAQRLGTGFLLMKRSVFDAMLPKAKSYHPDLAFDDHSKREHDFYRVGVNESDDRYMSEDYGLCDFWREECGGKVHAYLGVDLVHHGHYAYSGNVRAHFAQFKKSKR